MGLQRKTGTGIQTQEWQPYWGENYWALAEWGPHGRDPADGAGSLNHGFPLLFLRYSTLDWAEGRPRGFGEEGRGSCSFGVVNRERGPCGFGVLLVATRLRQQERLCWEEKGRQDSCWWAVRRCLVALD